MKKAAVLFAVCVLLVAFAFGAMAPVAHSAKPKLVKCWSECVVHVERDCCKYVLPGGGGTYTECIPTGFTCAEIP